MKEIGNKRKERGIIDVNVDAGIVETPRRDFSVGKSCRELPLERCYGSCVASVRRKARRIDLGDV